MKRLSLLTVTMLFGVYFLTGCGEKNEQTENKEKAPLSEETNTEKSNTETPPEQKEVTEKKTTGDKDVKKEKRDIKSNDKIEETATKNASDDVEMVTAEFNCSGMTCTGCEKTIMGKVKKLDGVKEVKADHKKQMVQVTFQDGKTNEKEIEETINAAGYKCERKN